MDVEKQSGKKIATPLDLHDAGEGHLLFSPKLIACLGKCGVNNIQYFECEVENVMTGKMESYLLGNIVGVVEALDKEKADCEIDEDGMVEIFYTLVIDKAKAKGHKLFRMYENLHTILVSGEIRQSIEREGITGILWMGEDDWDPGT